MLLDTYLSFHGTNLSELTKLVQEQLSPQPRELIYLTGSLVEGSGNFRSDIDIYLISDRDFSERFTCASVIIIPFATCPVDVEVLSFARVNELIDRLQKFPSGEERDPREALAFSLPEIKFLHNLLIAKPLFSEKAFLDLVGGVDKRNLSRIIFDRSTVGVSSVYIDILGLIEDADYLSARYLLNQLLGYLGSAFLAALGNTNPAEKWMVRKLSEFKNSSARECLPQRGTVGSVAAMFSDLYIQCDPTAYSVKTELARIIRLSNVVIPWGQRRFLANDLLQPCHHQHSSEAITYAADEDHCDNAEGLLQDTSYYEDETLLPQLDLNCRIQYDPQGYRMSHLYSTKTVYINEAAYELLLCFNGNTTVAEAAALLKSFCPASSHEIIATINDFKSFLQDNDFS